MRRETGCRSFNHFASGRKIFSPSAVHDNGALTLSADNFLRKHLVLPLLQVFIMNFHHLWIVRGNMCALTAFRVSCMYIVLFQFCSCSPNLINWHCQTRICFRLDKTQFTRKNYTFLRTLSDICVLIVSAVSCTHIVLFLFCSCSDLTFWHF